MSRENGHSFFPVYTRDKLDGNRSDRKEGEREREREKEKSHGLSRDISTGFEPRREPADRLDSLQT